MRVVEELTDHVEQLAETLSQLETIEEMTTIDRRLRWLLDVRTEKHLLFNAQ